MHWITLETAEQLTGLTRRTLWRRIAGRPDWKRNQDDPLRTAQIALEAIRADLRAAVQDEEDLAVIQAADQGDPEAMNDTALLLLEGGEAEAALPWLRRAARAGHADAMHWLGRCYVSGDGVTADRDLGLDWLRRSAAAGHVISKKQIANVN